MKEILFTKAAENALTSLQEKDQQKAISFLKIMAEHVTAPQLQGKVDKLIGTTENLFSLRLNLKLRVIVQLSENEVKVIDILNHDLFERYFKNK